MRLRGATAPRRLALHAAQRLARRAGCELIQSWRVRELGHELYLRRLLAHLEADTVVDVGANRGQFVKFMREQCGFTGQIISFEPVPELAAVLRQKAAHDPAWDIVECALGRTPGSATFNVMAHDDLSSFLEPSKATAETLGEGHGNRVERRIEVRVDTLDSCLPGLLARAAARRPLLKLDTQGFDLEVIAGAEQVLPRFAAISSEVSFAALYEGMPLFDESRAAFEGRGFVFSEMFPLPFHFPRVVDADCYFVRHDLVPATDRSV